MNDSVLVAEDVETNSKKGVTVGDMAPGEFATLLAQTIVQTQKSMGVYAQNQAPRYDPENDDRNAFNKTLGVVGNTLHGAIDVAEGFSRGVVDVITLGNARRY